MIKEGERTLLMALTNVKDSPVTLAQASPQIEQFLYQKKSKDAADGLLKSLRAAAKIEYLNKGSASASASASATASAPAAAASAASEAAASAAGSASAKTDAQKAVDAGFK